MPTVDTIHRRGTRADQLAIPVGTLTVSSLMFITDELVTERWNGTTWESYSAPASGGAPGAHAPTHEDGGTDPLGLDTLAPPTDILTLNATATEHGLLPKLSGAATDYLDGTGAWTVPPVALHAADHEAVGPDPLDVTQLDGYPGGGTTFLRDDGTFASAAGGAPGLHGPTHNAGGADPVTALDGAVITTGTVPSARLPPRIGAIGLVLDGGGSVLTTGVKGFVEVPFAGVITAVTLLSTDAAVTPGSIVLDIWKAPYASYPPTVANTITAGAKPTLSGATKSRDTTLTSWTTALAAGDVLGFTVDSVTTLTRVTLSLTVQVT